MNKEQIKHMERIENLFSEQMKKKYEIGAIQHGGMLWNKAGIIDMAIEESIDMVVYLLTLKDQLYSKKYYELKVYDKKEEEINTTTEA